MKNIWLRVGLRAGAIFAIGMIIVSVVRFGKSKIHDLVDSDSDINIPLMGIVPFNLSDVRLGELRQLTLLRDDPRHLSGVVVEARLGDSATVEPFKDCTFLTVNDPEHLNERTRFVCVQDSAGLASFGTVRISHQQGGEGTTLERTLLLSPEQVAALQVEMGPRVNAPDAAQMAELERLGESMNGMADSIREVTMIQVRLAQEQARMARGARGARGRTEVAVRTVDGELPPVAPVAPGVVVDMPHPSTVSTPTMVRVSGKGSYDVTLRDIRGQTLYTSTHLTSPGEFPWHQNAVRAEVTIHSQDQAQPIRAELLTRGTPNGPQVVAAGAGGTTLIRLRFTPTGYRAEGL